MKVFTPSGLIPHIFFLNFLTGPLEYHFKFENLIHYPSFFPNNVLFFLFRFPLSPVVSSRSRLCAWLPSLIIGFQPNP